MFTLVFIVCIVLVAIGRPLGSSGPGTLPGNVGLGRRRSWANCKGVLCWVSVLVTVLKVGFVMLPLVPIRTRNGVSCFVLMKLYIVVVQVVWAVCVLTICFGMVVGGNVFDCVRVVSVVRLSLGLSGVVLGLISPTLPQLTGPREVAILTLLFAWRRVAVKHTLLAFVMFRLSILVLFLARFWTRVVVSVGESVCLLWFIIMCVVLGCVVKVWLMC